MCDVGVVFCQLEFSLRRSRGSLRLPQRRRDWVRGLVLGRMDD